MKVFRYHSMKGSGNIFLLCMEILIKSFERKPKMHLKKNVALLKLNYLLIDGDHHQENHMSSLFYLVAFRGHKKALQKFIASPSFLQRWYHFGTTFYIEGCTTILNNYYLRTLPWKYLSSLIKKDFTARNKDIKWYRLKTFRLF